MADEITLIRLSDGEPEAFPSQQAHGILDLQQRMRIINFQLPATEAADSVPTDNATNGPTGNSVDTKTSKRRSDKTGAAGQ